MAAIRRYRFPWRGDNRFELLVDGRTFFPRMLECIESARREVRFEFYFVESGAVANGFIDALTRAAGRGVNVKALLDGFGARGLSRHDEARLTAGGAELAVYNRLRYSRWLNNFFRDHRKLLLVDGQAAFVGGAGIADAFAPPDGARPPWRDNMVRIAGPVVMDWQALFDQTWAHCTGIAITTADALPAVVTQAVRGRVAATNAEIKRSIVNRARAARSRLWVATAYFVPSRKLLRALRRAARVGVDVRLLLPGPLTDHPPVRHVGRRFFGRLLADGVRIFEYQRRMLHAKVALCDDWVSVGSSNLDRWTLRWNLEANQEVDDPAFAVEVQAMFEADFLDSLEWHHALWQQRPWHLRAREHLWGVLARWIT
jgi:phosphatidylserine/phosphatidylglycerophosphate/cardiolipin synthase-like enzyme